MFNLTDKIIKIDGLESRCFSDHDKLPATDKEILTVAGSAPCLQDDLDKFGIVGDLATINQAYKVLNNTQMHFVSAHMDKHHEPLGIRHTITPRGINRADYFWYFNPGFISSGLLAAWIGLSIGYKKIILIGVPLDGRVHAKFLPALKRQTELFKNVRSVSGNTKDALGEPTEDWIHGNSTA